MKMKYKFLLFLNSVVLASGLLTLLIGLLVIIGWSFDISILKNLNPGHISMKLNTALCLIFSGILIMFLRNPDLTVKFRYLIRLLSIIILLISTITLFEYIFNWNSGIDNFLIKEGLGATATIYPGRMAINTAVCFILISFAFILIDSKYLGGNPVSQFLVLLTGLISVLPQLGYAYNVPDLFTFAYQTPMALNTSIAIFILSIGILFLRPTTGILKFLGIEGPAGFFARRLFPVIFVLPVLIIWSRIALEAKGYVFHLHDIGIIALLYALIFIIAFRSIIKSMVQNEKIRKLSEEKLNQSEVKYRKMFENAQDIFYQADIGGMLQEISPSVFRIAGYRQEELIGKPVSQLFNNSNDMDILANELLNKGEVWDYEIQLKTKAAAKTYASLNAHLRFDPDGKLAGTEGSFRRIDERKEFEIQLKKAKEKAEENDRLKSAFLHNVSHEIRTPLNAILGFVTLLSEPDLSAADQAFYAKTINEESDQLLSIVNTILDISTAEAKIIKKNVTGFNLNATLQSVFRQYQLQTTENSNTLNIKLGLNDDDAMILSDHTKLVQIISNLLNNAFKFTNKGNVEFGYTAEGNVIKFYVSDTGIGIPSDQHTKIFENFYQVESTFNRKYGGTGLGLSICRVFTELLGGKIWVSSEPDKGSTFYFDIPIDKPEVTPSNISSNIELTEIGKEVALTILVAEDNDINFALINNYLSDQSVKVLRAKNGEEAVDIFKSTDGINLVLMDIKMPVMDGYTATKLINEYNPEIPVIAQTVYVDDREIAIKAGCIDLIAKPFRKVEFLEIIHKYLGK